jgi:putative inorganic carbon (hco3(-)) transporter
MTGLVIWAAIAISVFLSLRSPFGFALIYVWIEFFRPQEVAPTQFTWLSISLVAGILALIGMILASPQRAFKFGIEFIWLLLLAGWITLTTTWAIVPVAWIKWDTAFKTIVFCALLSHFVSKRSQLEAIILAIISGSAAQILSFGLKGFITGGGYQQELGVVGGNAGLAESSTLSVFASALIPYFWFLAKHSQLLGRGKALNRVALGATIISFAAVVATHARAGLLSFCLAGFLMLIRTKRGIATMFMLAVFAGLSLPVILNTDWYARMSTLNNVRGDDSAMQRVAVWKWTLEFIQTAPWGGGFNVDQINSFTVESDNAAGFVTVVGRAFHSIYFEVLGEHGIPGFVLYFGLVLLILFRLLFFVRNKTLASEESLWCKELAHSSLISWCAFLTGSGFVGIAFMPYLFFFLVISICTLRLGKEAIQVEGPLAHLSSTMLRSKA